MDKYWIINCFSHKWNLFIYTIDNFLHTHLRLRFYNGWNGEKGVSINELNACSSLYVCVICWNVIPIVMVGGSEVFGTWLGHESRALVNRISAHVKENPRSSLTLSTMWGHRTVCEWERGLSPDTGSVGDLILDYSASRLWETNVWCLRHPVYSILL